MRAMREMRWCSRLFSPWRQYVLPHLVLWQRPRFVDLDVCTFSWRHDRKTGAIELVWARRYSQHVLKTHDVRTAPGDHRFLRCAAWRPRNFAQHAKNDVHANKQFHV